MPLKFADTCIVLNRVLRQDRIQSAVHTCT